MIEIGSYSVVSAAEAHFPGLHRALGVLAREKRYLAFTEAPPHEESLAFYAAIGGTS